LLIAFLAAVMVSGGGGVTAPWMPRPADPQPRTVTVANAQPVVMGGYRSRLRME
jgi:hypothetical protein